VALFTYNSINKILNKKKKKNGRKKMKNNDGRQQKMIECLKG
jgi:hypothetical protein